METDNKRSITYAWQDVKYDWQVNGLCKTETKLDKDTEQRVPYTVSDFYPESGKCTL